jgi:hypothetical protein
MTARGELGAQLTEVVYLAAVGEGRKHSLTFLGNHRLAPTLEVDDGEASVAQRNVRCDPEPLGVRATAGHRVSHGLRSRTLRCEVTVEVYPTSDATHLISVSFRLYSRAPLGPLQSSILHSNF